ncbi:MAG: endospore germination permease [Sporomusaceae bacterium]|nr:endospore germination permease [Sporomusaceae bacterium]
MIKHKAFISPLQLFILYINISIGAGILTLPRSVAAVAGIDMWLSAILGGLLMFFALWVATRLSAYFPGQTSLEYHCLLLGNGLGVIAGVFQLLLLFGLASLAIRTFSFAMKIFLYDLTPQSVFIGGILIVAVYATQYNWTPLLRLQEVMFPFLFPMLIVILLLGTLDVSVEAFLPVLADGVAPAAKGALPSWFAYSAPELIIGLVYPFLANQRAAAKTGVASIAFITCLYTLTVIIVQGSLTAAGTEHAVFPTITAFRNVEIPDTFVERLDGYLMILWIFIYFNSLSNLLFMTAFGASRLLRLEYSRSLIAILAPLIYYVSQLAPSLKAHMDISELFSKIAPFWSLVIMPLLLMLAWYKNRRKTA